MILLEYFIKIKEGKRGWSCPIVTIIATKIFSGYGLDVGNWGGQRVSWRAISLSIKQNLGSQQ